MNAHLEAVPGVGTITARRTACRDHELLGGDANGSLDLVVELLRLRDNLSAGVLERLDFSASEGHANPLDLFGDLLALHLIVLAVHFVRNFLINNKGSIYLSI